MIDWLDALVGMSVGFILGAAVLAVFALYRQNRLVRQLTNAQGRAALLDGQIQQTVTELDQARRNYAETDQLREAAQNKVTSLSEKLAAKDRAFDEKLTLLDDAKTAMSDAFKALSAQALDTSNKRFLTLADEKFKPIKEMLGQYNTKIDELEKRRVLAYRDVETQVKLVAESHSKLETKTGELVSALRQSHVRGKWGEVQLRRVVELAGMMEWCDFSVQKTLDSDEGLLRPDMIIHMPTNRSMAVDAKVPLKAILDAMETDDEDERAHCMKQFVGHVQERIRELTKKDYCSALDRSPDFVILFLPGENFLYAAARQKPDIMEEAMEKGVVIATPSTLFSLLKAVAIGWRENALTENAERIGAIGKELHDRLCASLVHVTNLGRSLKLTVEHYDKFIGSTESRVLVSARKLEDFGAKSGKELPREFPVPEIIRRFPTEEQQPLVLHGDHPVESGE